MTTEATPGNVRLNDGLGLANEVQPLVARLRFLASGQDDQHSVAIAEAADEIERLLSERERDATPDQIIELAEALQVRRILEEIKNVAKIHPAADMPTPFQSAWQQCCEEIFYRATGEQWHMDDDAKKFARAANDAKA